MSAPAVVQAALQLAEEYSIPVFPCRQNKKPYTEHGFKDATTNLHAIEKAWVEHPDALVGVPTGRASRIDVVDIDPDGNGWYQEHAADLAAGRIHRTRRNGFHLLYRDAEVEIRNSAGRIARGVDIRGTGGYVVWWPAHGCEALGSLEDMTELPDWLLKRLTDQEASGDQDRHDEGEEHYIGQGQRNDDASKEAFRLKRQGLSPDQILAHLRTRNATLYRPMLEESELEAIVAGKKNVLPEALKLEDFYAFMPQHSYIYVPTREPWPAASVNARIVLASGKPSEWLDRHRHVEQMTWAPGQPMVIENSLASNGGLIEHYGCSTFNLYQPAPNLAGDPKEAGPWLAHLTHVFPEEAEHITRWLAHRVQHPGEKVNHALVLGGDEGVGKDTILEPAKYAIGHWNFCEVNPQQILGRFNGYMKSVILRVSEARDLGEVDRYALHEHLKALIVTPPDVLRCDEKNVREHSVMNVTGIIITTNHLDGIYLTADSRRYFVAWSELVQDSYQKTYWQDIYHWYHVEGGIGHVAAYLRSLDLSSFDPKAPPPKTAAFWRVVNAGRAPEDAEIADVLDALKNPSAVTISELAICANDSFRGWLIDRKNSRQISHRMNSAGYTNVPNKAAKDGLWKVDGKRQVIYGRRDLTVRDRLAAASRLARGERS